MCIRDRLQNVYPEWIVAEPGLLSMDRHLTLESRGALQIAPIEAAVINHLIMRFVRQTKRSLPTVRSAKIDI